MKRVSGVDQLFVRRLPDSTVDILVAKVVDDFLHAEVDSKIKSFFTSLDQTFALGATSVSSDLRFLGCDVTIKSDGSVYMGMRSYLERVRPMSISQSREHSTQAPVDDRERSEYRTLARDPSIPRPSGPAPDMLYRLPTPAVPWKAHGRTSRGRQRDVARTLCTTARNNLLEASGHRLHIRLHALRRSSWRK